MRCAVCQGENREGAWAGRVCASPLVAVEGGQALAAGTKLEGGLFAVGKVLGQGGFGITYLGSDLRRRRPVAVKEFFPPGCFRQNRAVQPGGRFSPLDLKSGRASFLQEACTLAQFRHPGIVQVHTAFEENNTAYLVMELLKGKPLSELVQRGPLPEQQAVGYAVRLGEALAVVHKQQVLHRDVKPENVIVTDDGRVVLIDFGTARQFAAGRTRHMTSMLTSGYAPLEQYSSQA